MTASSEAVQLDRGIGDNLPPEPTLKERIEETYAEQFGQIATIAEQANALPKEVKTDDECGQVADVAANASKLAKTLDKLRETEKAPYLRDSRVVDATFKEGKIGRLELIVDGLTKRITAFNRAKAAKARAEQEEIVRKAREAAEQSRLDAAMEAEAGNYAAVADHVSTADQAAARAQEATAPVKAAEVTRVVSDAGTKVTTRTEVKARVTSWQTIDLNSLRSFIKQDAVEAALRLHVKQFKKSVPITGVEFFDDETAVIRT